MTDIESAKELAALLKHGQAKVRKAAADVALTITGSTEEYDPLIAADVHVRLATLIGDDEVISSLATKALTNLSRNQTVVSGVLSKNVVAKLMDNLRDEDCDHKREIVMLLVNLTQVDEGCEAVMNSSGTVRGMHLRRLVQVMATPVSRNKNGIVEDIYEYVPHIIANMSRLEDVRAILLEPERRILPAFFPQLMSKNEIRRIGAAATLRNICFEYQNEKAVKYFMSPSVDLLTALTFPLCGPASLYRVGETNGMNSKISSVADDKKHEESPPVRRSLIESLLLLSSNKELREHMRAVKTYPVVRLFHEWLESDNNIHRSVDTEGEGILNEDDELTVESINRLVQQLYREDEVPALPLNPKDIKYVTPSIKENSSIKKVDLETASSIAKSISKNDNITEEEVSSLVTPVDWTE